MNEERRVNGPTRRTEARRDDDPLPITEGTWQEACGAIRKSVQQLQTGYLDFSRRVVLILCLIGFFLIGMLALEGLLLIDNGNRVSDIENSRVAQCIDQNHRHDATIAAFNAEIRTIGETQGFQSKVYKQAQTNEAANLTIINALVPKHPNCNNFESTG